MNEPQSDTPSPTCSPGVISGPCREKYWTELDDAGKIERLHQEVKRLMRRVDELSRTANDAHRIAEDHEHGGNGKVLMPVGAFNREQGNLVGSRRDEKYF